MPGPNNPQRMLVLMAKEPQVGRTKTRLTPLLSPSEAAELYQCFLLDKIAQIKQVEMAAPAIAYWPASARAYFADLAPGFELIEQVGDGLAARLKHVTEVVFEAGFEQVMPIDGDTPTLPPEYLRQGFEALDDEAVDVVLGPCEDGGYYAIGMKRPQPMLFDVTMSTPHVVRDTLARADEASLRVQLLPGWYDVDLPGDLVRLAGQLAGRGESSATAGFLAGQEFREMQTDTGVRKAGENP